MKPKISVFIATSLDGFIAREDGGLDWLDRANEKVPEGEDCGYHEFFDSVDVLVMGRKTYEKVLTFGEWPYRKKPVIIMSRKPIKIPIVIKETVSHSSESPKVLTERLLKKGNQRLYIDGGRTVQSFLSDGLVTDLTITIIPIILGSGIPLFSQIKNDIMLKHVGTKSYKFGFNQLSYEIE